MVGSLLVEVVEGLIIPLLLLSLELQVMVEGLMVGRLMVPPMLDKQIRAVVLVEVVV